MVSKTLSDIAMKRLQRALILNKAFVPSAPINSYELFAGRTSQLRAMVDAIGQPGRHALVYGERGVGKTSIVSILHEFLTVLLGQQVIVQKVICDSSDTFDSVWRKFFRQLTVSSNSQPVGFLAREQTDRASLSTLLPKAELTPGTVADFVCKMGELIIIMDEFDRVPSGDSVLFADTIKILSDLAASVTVVLVGIADNVDSLVQEHASIERAVSQIRMPRMDEGELAEIVFKGLSQASMTIDDDALRMIIALSQGLPHYTHLVSLHAARYASESDAMNVTAANVREGIALSVKHAQQTIVSAHHAATSSARKGNLYEQVALACALAPTDMLGTFQPRDVCQPLSVIMKKDYDVQAFARHLSEFCSNRRGPMLHKLGEQRRFRYRFVNPLLQPYLILLGLNSQRLTEEQLGFLRLAPHNADQ